MGKIEKSCVLNLAAKVHLRELVVCLSCRPSKHREMTRPENWKQSERFSLEKFLFEIKRVGCDSEKSENIGSEYIVEAIIKKKLLFKARPKPIIVVKNC